LLKDDRVHGCDVCVMWQIMKIIQRYRVPPFKGTVPSRSGKPAAVIGKRGQYEMMDRLVFLLALPWFYLAGYSSASKMDPAVPSRKSVNLPTLHSLTFQQAAVNLCLCGSPCLCLISQTS